MSGREWKPGDVAMVTWRHRRRTQPFTEHIAVMTVDGDWAFEDGRLDGDSEARPLVVIDPEDREQVERLLRGIAEHKKLLTTRSFLGPMVDDVKALQAALHEVAAPPKPDEPTGLGAVVETSGGRFVRSDVETCNPWRGPKGVPYEWDDITDSEVRVLSEGVTP